MNAQQAPCVPVQLITYSVISKTAGQLEAAQECPESSPWNPPGAPKSRQSLDRVQVCKVHAFGCRCCACMHADAVAHVVGVLMHCAEPGLLAATGDMADLGVLRQGQPGHGHLERHIPRP